MESIRVGVLPFYLKMHDELFPERRTEAQRYLDSMVQKLADKGLDVSCTSICCIKDEFDKAVEELNKQALDAVITLHIVYSPSLESIDALKRLNAPIIVLDTTPDCDFGQKRDPRMIRPNIGIHGVQDMCSLLARNNIKYWVVAGHPDYSDVLERTVAYSRAAKCAKTFKTSRIGSIGGSYKGMGDFLVTPQKMKDEIGSDIIGYDFDNDNILLDEITQEEIEREIEEDKEKYRLLISIDEDYRKSVKACLLTRKWIRKNNLRAFSANFPAIRKATGFPAMPFMEASKGMTRGIGYAGEGDTLTAGLIGALLSIYPETSFTEMFCPGWNNNTIFLSHMGEMNLDLCAEKPVVAKKKMIFSDTGDVACAYGCFKPGKAVLVNLTPRDKGFRLILSEVEMLDIGGSREMTEFIEGWLRPCIPITAFLERFSMLGGTHHSAICYNASIQELEIFGEMMGFDVRSIG